MYICMYIKSVFFLLLSAFGFYSLDGMRGMELGEG